MAMFADPMTQCGYRDVERRPVDVDEDRRGANAGDRGGCGKETVSACHNRVARADLQGHERGQECICPRRNANRMRHAEESANRLLELLTFPAKYELLRRQHLCDSIASWLPDRAILRLQIQQRHAHGREASQLGSHLQRQVCKVTPAVAESENIYRIAPERTRR